MGLLTKEEYKLIASGLKYPTNAFIGGEFRPAIGANTFTSINPATGETLAEIASCGQEDVDLAVSKAREAFDDGRWSRLHPTERKDILLKFCDLLQENALELAILESVDSGKTIFDCETVDVPETIHCLKWHAELIDKIYDQVSPASNDHIALVVREAIGVVGLVLPWNFPLLMLGWKVGPALASGCSLIIKPAGETTLTALRFAELAAEAGIPAGVLNIIPGGGAAVGEPIGRHMGIDMVSFTGSTVTGKRFLNYAAESNAKEVVLEMGGKNPCVVMDDAENLDSVAEHVVNGAFWNMGENCSATSRLIVHKDVKEELLKHIVNHAKEWIVGEPLDPDTRLGALVSEAHFKKVCSYLDMVETPVYGGASKDDAYVEATIVEIPNNEHVLAQEEIFGPILSVIEIESFDEAINMANDTEYGLCASIFTANSKRAIRGAREIKAGTVTVNCFGEGDMSTPFGGFKQSGFGGRDNSIHAHDQYTQLKTIWVDLSE